MKGEAAKGIGLRTEAMNEYKRAKIKTEETKQNQTQGQSGENLLLRAIIGGWRVCAGPL